MEILIAVISILAITILSWFINKFLPFKVCPICAGVSLTWLLLMAGIFTGQLAISNWQLVIAILMGGTVVGIAYQGEKRFSWAEKNIFFFKVPVIIVGFILVYLAINNVSWLTLGIEVVVLGGLIYLFFISPSKSERVVNDENSSRIKELEEKMKNCC